MTNSDEDDFDIVAPTSLSLASASYPPRISTRKRPFWKAFPACNPLSSRVSDYPDCNTAFSRVALLRLHHHCLGKHGRELDQHQVLTTAKPLKVEIDSAAVRLVQIEVKRRSRLQAQ